VDISCIILFHAEDLIAHRTLRSIGRATDYCEKKSLHVERVCVLDNAASLTRDIVLKSAPNLVVETSFGDPGLARNAGVQRASGEYVAFVDGDDFISENWLYNAYLQMEATSREVVLHPEVVLAFGRIQRCWRHLSQDSPKFHVGNLLCFNYWNSAAFLRRETCVRIPYVAARARNGFGYEDWHWNTLVVADGVKHEVVPCTAHFTRMKTAGSRWSEHDAAAAVIPRSPLFSQINVLYPHHEADVAQRPAVSPEGNISPQTHASTETLHSSLLRLTRACAHNIKLAARSCVKALYYTLVRPLILLLPSPLQARCLSLIHRVKLLLLEMLEPNSGSLGMWQQPSRWSAPDWLIEELKALSEIEPGLFPDQAFLGTVPYYKNVIPLRKEVPIFAGAMKVLGANRYSHVFLLPWLQRGGADIEALDFIRALVDEYRKNVLVITTENTDSPWLHKLPENVGALEFGKAARHLTFDEQRFVLLRLLLQLEPAVIHNINSHLGWSIYAAHGRCFSESSRLFASLFCEDYTAELKPFGYAHGFLCDAYSHLSCVLSDNHSYPRTLCDIYGFPEKLFRTIYAPTPETRRRRSLSSGNSGKVLWAGRLDRQKRPDLLRAIAQALPQLEFHVYGSPLLDSHDRDLRELRKCRNVLLHGVFDGFSSLPTQDFDLLLYTSQWDGLPNVLLAAAACGLPVVASSVGGVPELINRETGYLIEPYDDVPKFVAAILQLMSRPEEAAMKAERARSLVSERHSWEHFLKSVAALEFYLGDTKQ